jgi:hypothetical protein
VSVLDTHTCRTQDTTLIRIVGAIYWYTWINRHISFGSMLVEWNNVRFFLSCIPLRVRIPLFEGYGMSKVEVYSMKHSHSHEYWYYKHYITNTNTNTNTLTPVITTCGVFLVPFSLAQQYAIWRIKITPSCTSKSKPVLKF